MLCWEAATPASVCCTSQNSASPRPLQKEDFNTVDHTALLAASEDDTVFEETGIDFAGLLYLHGQKNAFTIVKCP